MGAMNTYEVTLYKVTTCKATVRVEASSPALAEATAKLLDLEWYVLADEIECTYVEETQRVSPAA